MTASTLTAEQKQILEKAIAWLKSHNLITPEAEVGLREHCRRSETDKQKALRLLQAYCGILRLSADQVELIRSVVERCPDNSINLNYMVKVDGIMQGPPPPPSKPKLAVGQIWRRRDGEIVTVDRLEESEYGDNYPFGAGGEWYTNEGFYSIDGFGHFLDLVECVGQVNYTEPKSCEH